MKITVKTSDNVLKSNPHLLSYFKMFFSSNLLCILSFCITLVASDIPSFIEDDRNIRILTLGGCQDKRTRILNRVRKWQISLLYLNKAKATTIAKFNSKFLNQIHLGCALCDVIFCPSAKEMCRIMTDIFLDKRHLKKCSNFETWW